MTNTVGDLPSPERLAGSWAEAMHGTSSDALSRHGLQEALTDLAERVLDQVTTERFDRGRLADVGRALVEMHVTDASSLEQILAVLGEQCAKTSTPARVERLAAVLGALAAGYARALQERTRTEQELITVSALAARADAERARWASEARFAAVFARSATGIGIAHVSGPVVEVNQAACDLLGYTRAELLARSHQDFLHPDDDPAYPEGLAQMLAGTRDHLRVEKTFLHKSGSLIRAEVVVSLVRDPDGAPRHLVGMISDVTEQRRMEDRLRHQAQHDPLTGLPNRTVFFDRLDAALAGDAHHVGVCYLDLDGFKAVNDTLGHAVGDELLQAVAGRLSADLAADGHLVARMGGDEFVVLVRRTGGREHLRRVAEQALDALRRPFRVGPHDISISASVGVVERDDGGSTGAELMKAADTTLYWAKNDGRNRYAVFDRDRHRADVSRFALSARMPDALAGGEFVVEYQPLVRLRDQHLVGVEALVRWRLPGGTVLGPDRFVPVAEETGLIVALGRSVLEQACRQAVGWARGRPPPLFLSVNVAARQVREPGIVADVARILRDTGWPAEHLQLELTESDLMATTGEPLTALRDLAAMGVRIAIDDFGTGYSNLAYLRELPVHVLKLAGPFVTGHPGRGGPDEVDFAVLAHLVRLAHTLGLSVTAEHVETACQARHLREMGCDLGQGWHFAPAGAAATIEEMLHGGPAGRIVSRPALNPAGCVAATDRR